jgi:hypothetical protein
MPPNISSKNCREATFADFAHLSIPRGPIFNKPAVGQGVTLEVSSPVHPAARYVASR